MKRSIHLLFITLFLLPLLSGCLYTQVKLPLDSDVSETQLGDKQGRATIKSMLWLFAWGDASTAAAAKDGFITRINHLDREQKIVLFGLYSETTTIAYGD